MCIYFGGLLCALPQNSMTGVPGVNLISSVTSSLFLNWLHSFVLSAFFLLFVINKESVQCHNLDLKSLSNTKGLNTPVF